MKFSKIFATTAFFLLAEHSTAIEKSFSLTTDPLCVEFNEFNLEGRSEFVDTDNSGIPPAFGTPLITTGDMQVAAYGGKFVLSTGGYTGSKYKLQTFELQAVCTTLEDQTVPSAPECRVEIDLKFCRKLTIVGFPDDIKLEKRDRGRELQTQLFEPKRITTEDELNALVDKNEPQIDAYTYRQLSSDLRKAVPSFCYGTREGKLTGIGTGPGKYAITGGTRDLFGAFGQIDFELVPNFFSLGYDATTGDVNLELRDTKLQFCYERACGSGKFGCH
uniref:Uncharacterized protein n=1 Tax=Helicotheca tamesis TaxID=374047 RepID=A0A7S2H1K2_9STRA|mmetsp:Transcript_14371/g.19673  ORF Transcript_14371/g.19673 Transcript_14371/m.19673 type:complete len:275 (+) Transcript_14371:76-900(+)